MSGINVRTEMSGDRFSLVIFEIFTINLGVGLPAVAYAQNLSHSGLM